MATRITTHTVKDCELFKFKADGDSEVATRVVKGNQNSAYDNAEFSVSTATTNYDVATNQTTLWSNVTAPTYISFRTDQTVTIKINTTTNAAITITSSDSPFTLDGLLAVDNIFITNSSGSTANIKILLI